MLVYSLLGHLGLIGLMLLALFIPVPRISVGPSQPMDVQLLGAPAPERPHLEPAPAPTPVPTVAPTPVPPPPEEPEVKAPEVHKTVVEEEPEPPKTEKVIARNTPEPTPIPRKTPSAKKQEVKQTPKPKPTPKQPAQATAKPRATPPVNPFEGRTPKAVSSDHPPNPSPASSSSSSKGPVKMDAPELPAYYLTYARTKIESNFHIPAQLKSNAQATVQFTVARDGTITNITITKSTGNAQMDDLAMQALRNTQTLGHLPDSFNQPQLLTTVTFDFSQ
ncbi:MAG: TonB family protein [bacterium]